MDTEFEAKVLDVDVKDMKKKLLSLGVKKYLDRDMKRYVYDIPGKDDSWMRLRDDGEKVTLTVKEIRCSGIEGTKEVETVVSGFEETNEILKKIGFTPKAYQENKRISYRLGDVELEMDFWPGLKPYLEIEAGSKEEVLKTLEKLGFEESDTTSINTIELYRKKGLDLDKIEELRFEDY